MPRSLTLLALLTLLAAPARAQGPDVATEPTPATDRAPEPTAATPPAPSESAAEPVEEPAEGAPLTLIVVPAEAPAPQAAPPEYVADEAPEPALEPAPPSRPFAIGLSGLMGSREDSNGELASTWAAGLDVALDIAPWARIAIRRIGYGQARAIGGDRRAISASPAFELSTHLNDVFEPYVQVGTALQVRFGDDPGQEIGVAPFLDGGLRFHPTEWLSIAVEGALHIPITSSFLLGHEIFPQSALVLQGGLAVAFHF